MKIVWKMLSFWLGALFLSLMIDVAPLYAQLTESRKDVVPEVEAPKSEQEIKDSLSIATLRGIIQATEAVDEQLAQKNQEYHDAISGDEVVAENVKVQLLTKIEELNERRQELQQDFEGIATGVDSRKYNETPTKIFDWQQELLDMLQPIMSELKTITARPRELERLRNEVKFYQKRLSALELGIENVKRKVELAKARKLKNQLLDVKTAWEESALEIQGELAVAQYQLDERLKVEESFIKSAKETFRSFFKNRGFNLILALSSFLTVFSFMRLIQRRFYKSIQVGVKGKRPFWIRLLGVVYHLLTLFIATVALLIVLYVSGDWVLLGLALIFLFGIAWTGKQALPRFWEQTKLFLNLSTVREGERVIYNDLPWKVLSLSIYTKLHNPALKGGLIRLPLQELIGLHSRPFYKDEPWFPSQEGDLVKLADGTIGTVILQTPERVVLDILGGSHKTYPTSSFLQQNPMNYSINNFGVFVTFGLDYAHQSLITRDIPKRLENMLVEELSKEQFGQEMSQLEVRFKEAAASSLDLIIIAKFPGHLASNIFAIRRAIQRIAVDACNKYGWGIPFPQVTIHSAVPHLLQETVNQNEQSGSTGM